jgi:hypothetical protein
MKLKELLKFLPGLLLLLKIQRDEAKTESTPPGSDSAPPSPPQPER